METQIEILAQYEQEANNRLNSLEKKAKKLNIDFKFSFGGSYTKENQFYTPVRIHCSEEQLKISGYVFIGIISRKDDVLTISEVPVKWQALNQEN